MEIEKVTKIIGAITAVFTLLGGGYASLEKFKSSFKDTSILAWHPEYFNISNGKSTDEFKVVAARRKIRDDCSVENFKIEIRDSDYIIHEATPSVSIFSGPASPTVDKFGYKFTIKSPQNVSLGRATLLAHITYKCPEGIVLINYPSHENLTFEITS